MSDFERELRQAKFNARQDAESAKSNFQKKEEELRQTIKRATELRRERIESCIKPIKPIVDRLLTIVGDETWGHNNWGALLEIFDYVDFGVMERYLAGEKIEAIIDSVINEATSLSGKHEGDEVLARWTIGGEWISYRFRRNFISSRIRSIWISANPDIGRSGPTWVALGSEDKNKPKSTIKEENILEYFSVSLRQNADNLFFTSGYVDIEAEFRDKTNGIGEEELKELLKREFIRGPLRRHPPRERERGG